MTERSSSIKTLILALAVAFAIGLLMACGSTAAEPIKIGVAGAHSGDRASYAIVNAVEMVVEKINANGGLLGRQIELIIEDDQCDAAISATTAARLVSEGVSAVIGHDCSDASNAALPAYVSENIVVISPSASDIALADFPNFFVTIATHFQQAETQVAFMRTNFDVSRVAILHDRNDYGMGLAEDARNLLEAKGVTVAVFEGIATNSIDYSTILNKIDSENVDAIIYGGHQPEASKLVQQMRGNGMNQMFFSGDEVKNERFIDAAGEAAEGVYATGPRDTSNNPLFMQATREHVEAYNSEPGEFFMNAYSAALALFAAIEKAGSTEYDLIISALKSNQVDTPLGRIGFDDVGLPTGIGYSVYKVEDGGFAQVQE